MKDCRLILALSVGYESVDVQAATERGIPVCNIPSYCTDEVANHAMTLLLAAARKIKTLLSTVSCGGWTNKDAQPIYNLNNKVLGIIGLGKIGRCIIPKAKGFGISVIAYDPYVADDIFTLLDAERAYDLEDLLPRVDYLSIHAPLTPETYHLINAKELMLLKDGALLINTARGEIVDEEALYAALRNGTLSGAGLDVLESDPPPQDHPLLLMENVIVTPLVAWYSEESFHRSMVQGMDEITGVFSGHRPRSLVNPQVLKGGSHEPSVR